MLSAVNIGFFNALKLWPETWATGIAYALGDVIRKTGTYALFTYKCTTAGTSGGTEPVWGPPVLGAIVSDGSTLKWTTYDEKTYQVKAKQSSTIPYVTFGMETDVPIGTFVSPTKMESLTFWVNCFSGKVTADADVGTAAVAEIADEVMTAMDDVTLSVTGYNPMKCVREFIGTVIWDLETGIYQVPLRYRLWLDKV